jgi:hypothetical protein
MKVFQGENMIIVCYSTSQLRRLANSQIMSTDKVLEIGCSTGECTDSISRYALILFQGI